MDVSKKTVTEINNLSGEQLAAIGALKRVEGKADEFICPFCQNGEGHDATGIKPNKHDITHTGWKCQRCGEKFNNVHILARHYGLDSKRDFKEICKRACHDFHISYVEEYCSDSYKRNFQPKDSTAPKTICSERGYINADLATGETALKNFIDSQGGLWRGLSFEFLRKKRCRFIKDWLPPKILAKRPDAKNWANTSPRMIIPASTDTNTANYLARLTVPIDSFTAEQRKYIKAKEHAGTKTLFNADLLTQSETVIAVEGYPDALTLEFCGYPCVATGGAEMYPLIIKALRAMETKPNILILFDPDATGRKAAPKLQSELTKIGCASAIRFLTEDISKLDPNQILVEQGADKLKEIIDNLISDAQKEFTAFEKKSVAVTTDNALTADEPTKDDNFIGNKNIDANTKRELDDAIIWLDTLEPENFTANDARDLNHIHSVGLALTYGFHAAAEKFFSVIKSAKKLAKIRLTDAESDLTKKLSEDERNELNALVEGTNIDSIRKSVDREVTAIEKAHRKFLEAENSRLAREKYERAKAMRVIEINNAKERLKRLQSLPQSAERDAEIVAVIRELCDWNHDRQGNPVSVKGTQANADLIFGNDPALDGLIGYDEFQQADVLLKPTPWRPKAKKGEEWSDRDDSQLRAYLRRVYTEFSNKEVTMDTVTSSSDAHRFHEVKQYFESLPKWDGQKRAETFFIDWLKVEDTPFAREVTLKWLLAAVARIFHPGCNFQWALVLHGNQKIGKGYVLQRLGGKWYISISDRVDDPHAVDTVRLVWIGEFKEMNGMRKADVNAIKDFIERPADSGRPAYGRRAITVPRHCVFAITVNDDSFLSDLTGNRRFLILNSNLPKFGYVREVRGEKLSDDNVIAQIWAEVYEKYQELFKDGFDDKKLELSSDAEHKGEEIAHTYLNDNGLTGEIKAFLDHKILPKVIWELLSKEDRRRFFVDNKFAIEENSLKALFKNSAKKISATRQAEFDDAIKASDAVLYIDVRNKLTGEFVTYIEFYGTEYRQHICAAEINAECFNANDKRKSIPRIHEILAHTEGWSLGKRIARDAAYGNQPKVYYRDADNQPDENDQNENDATPAQETPAATTNTAETASPTINSDYHVDGKPFGNDTSNRDKADEEFDLEQWNE